MNPAFCLDCERAMTGLPAWWHLCPKCYRARRAASKLAELPGQLALDQLPEWEDAVSPYLAYEFNRGRAA